jgi:hypothetical protein
METQFTTSFVRLEEILFSLGTQRLPNTTGSPNISQTPMYSMANHPASDSAGGTISDSTVGQG